MKIHLKLIYLVLIASLQIACGKQPTTNSNENNLAQHITTPDSLNFTSGIRAIFEDSKGNFWFGSHQEGVCRFDGKTYKYFTTEDGLASPQVRTIQEDKNGNIWFGTASGVNMYDGHTLKTIMPIELDSAMTKWSKSDSDLWFNASTREGVLQFDGRTLQYLPFPTNVSKLIKNTYSLTGVSKGKTSVWFATYAGVWGYDGESFSVINDESLGYTNPEKIVHVRSILEDSRGRLWIGNNGIGVLLKSNDKVIHFSQQQGVLLSMKEFRKNTENQEFAKNTGLQSVFSIGEDSSGNIWFGDRDSGLWKYDGEELTNHSNPMEKNSQMVWAIYRNRSNELLFGMGNSVYTFNGQSFEKRF